MRKLIVVALLAAALAGGCKKKKKTEPGPAPADAAALQPAVKLDAAPPLPETPVGLGKLDDPADNPSTPEKVALGQLLFFEKRMSKDDSQSCESCHHIANAYTSGQALDPKVGGAMNKRHAPSMLNVAYSTQGFYWDGRTPTLEKTVTAAWGGQLGTKDAQDAIAAKLNANEIYAAHFQRAFGGPATKDNIALAVAAFLRNLKTGGAPYDLYDKGDKAAASPAAQKGFQVFRDAGCAACHVPPMYTDYLFHNLGIGWDKPDTERDHGRMDASKDAKDDGRFKTPTLRDVARSAPYFHDGSAATLDDAIAIMLGETKLPGHDKKANPNLDENWRKRPLSAGDREALKAFLESLSGQPTFSEAPKLP